MKKQCDTKDYDFYSFSFPLSAFPRVKRNKYIYSQLEKIHPCFSDNCCFDYKFRLEKKGIKADVVVMQKYTLAEYKNSKRRIVIPERKRTVFFAGIKLESIMAVTAFIIVLGLILSGFVLVKKQKIGNDKSMLQIKETEKSQYPAPFESVVLLLQNAERFGGTSDFFSWELNGFTEKTCLNVRNIFPEQIMDFLPQAVFSSVQFDSDITGTVPHMTVQINQRLGNAFAQNYKYTSRNKAELRAFLMSQPEEVSIMEETVKPDAIKFSLRGDLKNKTEKVLAIINEKQVYISSLVIKKQGDEVLFEIVFSDMELKNQDRLIQTLMNSVSIFFEELVLQEEITQTDSKNKSQQQQITQWQNETQQEKLTLVGKIIHGDGNVTEYYKNQTGKIIKTER